MYNFQFKQIVKLLEKCTIHTKILEISNIRLILDKLANIN